MQYYKLVRQVNEVETHMEFMSRGGRPAAPSQSPHTTSQTSQSGGGISSRVKGGDPRGMRYLAVTLLIATALLVAFLSLYVSLGNNGSGGEGKYVETNKYQAVFLNNNQVYFGKVGALNSKYVVITDVFYLQVNQSGQTSSTTSSNNNLVLQKLGKTELHGPEDKMVINRDQVTFWENIKDTSQVVTAINKYKANPNAAQTTTGSTGTDSSNPQQSTTSPTTTTPKKP
jgi:hypothetical protein